MHVLNFKFSSLPSVPFESIYNGFEFIHVVDVDDVRKKLNFSIEKLILMRIFHFLSYSTKISVSTRKSLCNIQPKFSEILTSIKLMESNVDPLTTQNFESNIFNFPFSSKI